jgi:hypothetical protein
VASIFFWLIFVMAIISSKMAIVRSIGSIFSGVAFVACWQAVSVSACPQGVNCDLFVRNPLALHYGLLFSWFWPHLY